MDIELLVIPDCPHVDAASELIATALADTRVKATVTRTIVDSQRQAQQRGFSGSPTILLDGLDPFARPDAPVSLSCRLYSGPEGLQGLPALRDLRQALKRVAAGGGS